MAETRDDIYKQLPLVFQTSSNYVLLLGGHFPVIDAAGPGRQVYQITVRTDHKIEAKVDKLLISAGLLDETGKLSEAAKEPLYLLWLVPPNAFN
jgi:hypothetical protein